MARKNGKTDREQLPMLRALAPTDPVSAAMIPPEQATQLIMFDVPEDTDDNLKNNWYTPRLYVELARVVFGGVIDLDPASCQMANEVVKARTYYDIEADGLQQTWAGKVWMNPPYSPTPKPWTDKLIDSFIHGYVTEAIYLVPPKTDTEWFLPSFDHMICFTDHRIKFWGQPGSSNVFGSALVYLGPHRRLFNQMFSPIGNVVIRYQEGM